MKNETFEQMKEIAEKSFTARPKRFVLELCDALEKETEYLKRENEKLSDSLKYHRSKVDELKEQNQRLKHLKTEVNGMHDICNRYESVLDKINFLVLTHIGDKADLIKEIQNIIRTN
jgi:cell division septum initiation protein DivIVA